MLATGLGTDPATVALAWAVAHSRTWVSVGSGSAERVRQALDAARLHLSPDQLTCFRTADPYFLIRTTRSTAKRGTMQIYDSTPVADIAVTVGPDEP